MMLEKIETDHSITLAIMWQSDLSANKMVQDFIIKTDFNFRDFKQLMQLRR
jgi:hypothetical protein